MSQQYDLSPLVAELMSTRVEPYDAGLCPWCGGAQTSDRVFITHKRPWGFCPGPTAFKLSLLLPAAAE